MIAVILTAFISAITSLLVALGTQYFSLKATRHLDQAKERDQINLTYLNPLRLYLEEVYARLTRITDRIEHEQGTCLNLLSLEKVEDLPLVSDEWFTEQGYYLMSSCYLTACLFFQIDQVRDNVPFLQMSQDRDTELVNRLFDISLAFGKTGGIFYILQNNIAEDISQEDVNKPISYRTFCKKLQDPNELIWFKQLVAFYLEIGQGKKGDRLENAKTAISGLLKFLESTLSNNIPIEHRIR